MAYKYQFVDYEISIGYHSILAPLFSVGNSRCIGGHWDAWDSQAANTMQTAKNRTEDGPW